MGNCNKKEQNRDMIQDEIMASKDRPMPMSMPGAKTKKNDDDSDSDSSRDSYGQIGGSMLNIREQNTNSTDVPGNLWMVETRSIDQLIAEIEELVEPVKTEFLSRDKMIANEKITIELDNDDIIYDEVGAIVNPANSDLQHN